MSNKEEGEQKASNLLEKRNFIVIRPFLTG